MKALGIVQKYVNTLESEIPLLLEQDKIKLPKDFVDSLCNVDNARLILNMIKDSILIAEQDGEVTEDEKSVICQFLSLYFPDTLNAYEVFSDWAHRSNILEEEGVDIFNRLTGKE